MALRPAATERLPEDPPRGALAAGCHPHRVNILGLGSVACARLAGDHPGKVETEDLPTGLGEVVVDLDPRRLAHCEMRPDACLGFGW
jgi:hypothetical protein